jgi:predicted deacylase
MRGLFAAVFALAALPGLSCVPSAGEPDYSVVGRSVQGRPIHRAVFGAGTSVTLILGGFHGDEPEGAQLAERFARHLASDEGFIRGELVVVVPVANPDGLASGRRTNAHGVDLNRNVAVSNWDSSAQTRYFSGDSPVSEPETRAVRRLIEFYRPKVVVSIHSIAGGKQCVNYDGPARDLAERMSKACGYPPAPSMGYSTPGSFGTYCGGDLGIPTITLELPHGGDMDEIWERGQRALMEAVKWRAGGR